MDTTVPGIDFDDKGECNFCKLHDKMDKEFPLGQEGEQIIQKFVHKIKLKGKGKKFKKKSSLSNLIFY